MDLAKLAWGPGSCIAIQEDGLYLLCLEPRHRRVLGGTVEEARAELYRIIHAEHDADEEDGP